MNNAKFKILFLIIFCILFLILIYADISVLLKPFKIKSKIEKDYILNPCVILTGKINEYRASRGRANTRYTLDIMFKYVFEGKEYISNKNGYGWITSLNIKVFEKIIQKYPVDSQQLCYVNPKNPMIAYLSIDYDKDFIISVILSPPFFFLPFIIVFLGFPIIHLYGQVKLAEHSHPKHSYIPLYKKSDKKIVNISGLEGLKMHVPFVKFKTGLKNKIKDIIILAVIWFIVITIAIAIVLSVNKKYDLDLKFIKDNLLLLSPFILIILGITLALLVNIIEFILSLISPHMGIKISPAYITLGELVELEWNLFGRKDLFKTITIELEGREEISSHSVGGYGNRKVSSSGDTYLNGDNVFYKSEILNLQNELLTDYGKTNFILPENLISSYETEGKRIMYLLKIKSDIKRRIDVKEEFKIIVLP